MTNGDASHPGRLRSDICDRDWILDRNVECADTETLLGMSQKAWEVQSASLVERSPFYRRKWAEAGVDITKIDLRDLSALPFTVKAELKASQEEYPPFGDYLGVPVDRVKRVYQTSGTTGRPSVIALTATDAADVWGRVQSRSYFASGVHEHSSVISTYGAGPFVAGSTHRVHENLGARTVPVGPGDTERVLAAFTAGLVDTYQGTPTFAQYLANLFEERGIDGPSLGVTHLLSGGEPGGGLPAIRQRIETAFGGQVTEIYGLGDIMPSLFGECPVGGGLHFCGQGIVWAELVDRESGEPITIEPGAIGEPVYTALTREAMPLVRFRSGDIFEIQDADCPCGRSSWRMRCVGRADDMFIVRGVNVYPSAIQSVVADFRPDVTGRARAVLPGEGVSVNPPVIVEVEIADGARPAEGLADRINGAIRSRLVFRSDVRFVAATAFGDAAYKTRGVRRVGEDR